MKIIFTILLASLSISALSQVDDTIKIKGKSLELRNEKITLRHSSGLSKVVAATKDGNWHIEFIGAPEGYYQLNKRRLYLKKGANIILNDIENGIAKGVGAEETNLLLQLAALPQKIIHYTINGFDDSVRFMAPEVFYLKLMDLKTSYEVLLANNKSSENFNRTQLLEMDAVIGTLANRYKSVYGISKKLSDTLSTLIKEQIANRRNKKHVKESIPISEIKRMSPSQNVRFDSLAWSHFDMNNEELYSFSDAYKQLVDLKLTMIARTARRLRGNASLNQNFILIGIVNDSISNGYIKKRLLGNYTRILLESNIPDTLKQSLIANYFNIDHDSAKLNEYSRIYESGKIFGPGSQTPDFNFSDVNGKLVSLSDLRGSLVYIDFWATWCVPCIEEIPHLKELQKDFINSDIKFVSISIDKKSDRIKWKNFVTTKALSGIQLIADDSSSLIKKLNVSTIPRFLLIDRDGKIIASYALRPSNPALHGQLKNLTVRGD